MSDYSRSDSSKKKKYKKIKTKKDEGSDDAPDTESSDEELDLTKDCHPIAHYMNDRAEMISQMFSVIKGKKLKAMLPPILKDYDIEKLKLQCLDQLLGMSEKRINCILEGEILETSSESDVATDAESKDSSDSSSSSSEEEEKASKHSSSKKIAKRKSETDSIEKSSKISKTDEAPPVEQGKTLLEILELEMRARAIRALLKQGGETEQASTSEEAPNGDIVDLTVDEEEFPRVIKVEPQSTEQELSFNDKVVKSVESEKKKEADEKKKKLMADLELRNKLIKKKTYRTKQQRIDNLGEEKANYPNDDDKDKEISRDILPEVKVKEEPKEIVIEDAEEGEVSSEEEEPPPVVIKEEKPESPESSHSEEKQIDGERIMAIDNGEFVSNKNLSLENELMSVEQDQPDVIELVGEETEDSQISDKKNVIDEESGNSKDISQDDVSQPETERYETENLAQDTTTWRERWLRNDEVQKVVKSSKICGLVKKRIAKKKIMKAEEEKVVEISEPPKSAAPPVDVVEGSVREYEILSGKTSEEKSIENVNSVILEPTECSNENESIDHIIENG